MFSKDDDSTIDEMTEEDKFNIQKIDLKQDLSGYEVQFEGLDSTVIDELTQEFFKKE